jgi:uncharacterized repeat protein (TIGR03803 family)
VNDAVGNLYGTGNAGGTYNYGVVFKISKGAESVLYNFKGGTDGAYPQGVLIRDKSGNLYGTTTAGGATGNGTVYRVTAAGQETVLYSFAGGTDGAVPQAGLARDTAGNLYGTTTEGGASGNGTVFELSPAKKKGAGWSEQILYSFGPSPDGAVPVAGVTLDAAGNLYGTASTAGAYGYGRVYELSNSGSGWTETSLHDFTDVIDGGIPYAGLIADSLGNLYGAATEGGDGGGGTVFAMSQSGGVWNFTVIYTVPGWGISGAFRDLMMDSSGNLYGTTHCDGTYNAGTVYKLTPASGSWTFTSLYVFTGGTDGLYSFSNLVLENKSVYGTTNLGGANGMGTVFRVTL